MVSTTRRGCRIRSKALRQQIHVTAQDLAHAALDAVALMRLAQHFTGSETDPRPGMQGPALRRQKPTHRSRLAFAACSISALIVGVLA